ncbi:hypothetical protein [Altericista sp. CCNU0014]|uniref:COG1470 family protein n=1 Tax=Altericista sp. CCNU0014 TaxID=3082949 RepID=UPI00384D25E6
MTDRQPNPEGSTLIQAGSERDDTVLQATEDGESIVLPITAGSPLAVIFNTAGKDSLIPGAVFTLSVTVSNKGAHSAVIDIWIDPISEAVRSWYAPVRDRLALGSGQSNEAIFHFRVPVGTLPGLYSYQVVVDAQEHYPEDTPLSFPQQLQVLATVGDIVRDSHPTFLLQPATRSTAPVLLRPGEALQMQVTVENRGDRVDRFRLMCPDLPQDWYRVIYPEGVQGSGLVVASDSLNLNPGERGLILWSIAPPLNTLAGHYVPTLRVYSDNYPDLMLIDLVYLQVLPTYTLQLELRTLIGRIERQAGLFQVRFHNAGNTPRTIALQAQSQEEGNRCSYTWAQPVARILPQETVGVNLQVLPRNKWQRPFFGGRVFNFNIGLEDTQRHPLPVDNLQGILVWEPRPWWHLLSLAILGLLILAAIAYLIWWFAFRKPPPLKILEFYPENSAYAAENGDVIRLGWQISQPQRIQSITIQGMSAEGEPLTRPDIYDLSQGLPSPLKGFCTQSRSLLLCRNFRTSARKAGTYIFEMTLQSNAKDLASLTRKTSPVQIAPIPLPQVVTFGATQPAYLEQSPLPARPPLAKPLPARPLPASNRQRKMPAPIPGIRLNWQLTHPARLQELRLIGLNPEGKTVSPMKRFDFSRGLPATLQPFCKIDEQLVCKNVATGINMPGDYTFELSAVPKPQIGQAIATKKSESIKVLPLPTQILAFNLNGQPARPSYLIPIVPPKAPKLLLSWHVKASQGTQLSLVPFPGNVPLQGSVPIILGPTPASNTLTLQAISPAGEQVARSVTIETYDPNATNPEKVAAAAAAAAAAQIAKAQQQAAKEQAAAGSAAAGGATAQPTFQLPRRTPAPPLTPDSLAPLEQPPQLDRR